MTSSSAQRPWRAQVVCEQSELDALADAWRRLHAQDPRATPFQTHAWLAAWARAYLRPGALRVVLVYCAEELVGAAPLHLERRGPWAALTAAGGPISDHNDVLVASTAPEDVWDRLSAAVMALPGWDVIDLPEVRPRATAQTWAERWPGAVHRAASSIVLELPAGSIDTWLRRMPGPTAKTMRKKLRKVDQAALSARPLAPEEVDDGVESLLRLHGEQWRGRGGNPEHSTERFRRHLHEALGRMTSDGSAILTEFRSAGELVGSHVYLVGGGALCTYLGGVTPGLRAVMQTSALLMKHDASVVGSLGVQRLSMLRGTEDYKFTWRPDVVQQERVVLVRPRPSRSRGYAAVVRARYAATAAVREHAPWVRDVRDHLRRRVRALAHERRRRWRTPAGS